MTKLTDLEISGGKATKEFHDFFTSSLTAQEIANDLLQHAVDGNIISILEPSVGTGQLIWPLLSNSDKLIISVNDMQEEYLKYVIDKACALQYKIEVVDGFITISN